MPLHSSSLLFLLGGGRSPRYPPNKVILWDEPSGQEVAELEFREKVRGLACRRGWLAVALRRRVVAFEVGETVTRYGEWDTCDNPRGESQSFMLYTPSSAIRTFFDPGEMIIYAHDKPSSPLINEIAAMVCFLHRRLTPSRSQRSPRHRNRSLRHPSRSPRSSDGPRPTHSPTSLPSTRTDRTTT